MGGVVDVPFAVAGGGGVVMEVSNDIAVRGLCTHEESDETIDKLGIATRAWPVKIVMRAANVVRR